MKTTTVRLRQTKSDDGIFEFRDDVKVGTKYNVVLKTRQFAKGYNKKLKIHWVREIIFSVDNDKNLSGWLPVELLENIDGTPL